MPARVPKDRLFYRQYYGFDPEEDRIFLSRDRKSYRYEATFPLTNDPLLAASGIVMCARVDYYDDDDWIHNRIVFRRGWREKAVNCVHTAIYALPPAQLADMQENGTFSKTMEDLSIATPSQSYPIDLPPEDHFASLKSYVAAIAEVGVANMMTASFQSPGVNPETLAVGFNAAMQRQVIQALTKLAPDAVRAMVIDIIFAIAEAVPLDWFEPRLPLFQQIYRFDRIFCTDPSIFEALDEQLHSSTPFRIMCAEYEAPHAEILAHLVADPDYRVRMKVLSNPRLTPTQLEQLANDDDPRVQEKYEEWEPIFNLARLARKSINRMREFSPKRRGYGEENDHITQLSLVELNLLEIPATFARLKHLKTLVVTGNRIKILPAFLQELTEVESISLSRNRLKAMGPAFLAPLCNLPNLRKISLQGNRLRFLPDDVGTISALETLNLNNNQLRSLPNSVSNLHNLKFLNLAGDRVQTLPEDFGNLSQLEAIDLSNNHWKVVPPQCFDILCKLPQLRALKLRGNQLREMPERFSLLSNLEVLDLRGNNLTRMPESFASLAKLKFLNLSKNKFSIFPASVLQLPALRRFSIANNMVGSISREIGNCGALRVFNCENNRLQQIPASICNLQNLEELILHGNKITQLPLNLGNLTALRKLIASKNRLVTLPDSIGMLESLATLQVEQNFLTFLPPSLMNSKLQILNLASNQFTTFPAQLLKFPALKELDVRHNPLGPLPQEAKRLGRKMLFFH